MDSLQKIPDPHQQPPVNRVSSGKRHQLSAVKQGQKSHSRSLSLPPIPLNLVKGNQPLMESVKTTSAVQKSHCRSRQTSLTMPLVSADVSAPRKRPTSAKATCFAIGLPSPTRKICLPPLQKISSSILQSKSLPPVNACTVSIKTLRYSGWKLKLN